MKEFKMAVTTLPPAKRGRKGEKIQSILAFLRDNENKWCRVAEYAKAATAGSTASIWKGRYGSSGYEFVSRHGDGVGYVYGRYTKPKK